MESVVKQMYHDSAEKFEIGQLISFTCVMLVLTDIYFGCAIPSGPFCSSDSHWQCLWQINRTAL